MYVVPPAWTTSTLLHSPKERVRRERHPHHLIRLAEALTSNERVHRPSCLSDAPLGPSGADPRGWVFNTISRRPSFLLRSQYWERNRVVARLQQWWMDYDGGRWSGGVGGWSGGDNASACSLCDYFPMERERGCENVVWDHEREHACKRF